MINTQLILKLQQQQQSTLYELIWTAGKFYQINVTHVYS